MVKRISFLWIVSLILYYLPSRVLFPLCNLDFGTWIGLAVYLKLKYSGLLILVLCYSIVLFSVVPIKYYKAKAMMFFICLLEAYTACEYSFRAYQFVFKKIGQPVTVSSDIFYTTLFCGLLLVVLVYTYLLLKPIKFDPFFFLFFLFLELNPHSYLIQLL